MSRALAPVLLVLLAASSIGAVFAIHRIERRGGPLGEPYATLFASPNADGHRDVVTLRFNDREGSTIDVDVVAHGGPDDGARVRRLVRDRVVKGVTMLEWDGTGDDGSHVPDGRYELHIRRLGDRRIYAPARPTTIDTRAPVIVNERCRRIVKRRFTCAVSTEPFANLEVAIAGERLHAPREMKQRRSADQPKNGLVRWLLTMTVPPDAEVDQIEVVAVDRAGNRARIEGRRLRRGDVDHSGTAGR